VLVVALALVGLAVYHFLSPKVIVTNRSGYPIEEVTLSLPTNRVVFSAIKPDTEASIYYSPQSRSGKLHYSIQVNDTAHEGSLPYSDSTEYGRVIRIDVDPEGLVKVEVSK
jgi:hypothetical protein